MPIKPSLNILLRAALCLAVLIPLSAGCESTPSGEQVTIEREAFALPQSLRNLCQTKQPARLGDLISKAGIPVAQWDRMYEFSFPPSTEKTINTALGTPDLHWKGLPRPASDTAKIRVFVHQGKVVYAFSNAFLFDGPSNGPYATPDSIVHDANDLTCRVLIE